MERRNLRRWLCTLALAIAMLPLAACGADCGWSGRGEAWIDQNEDGVWDSDEVPLDGVEFAIHDAKNNAYSPELMVSAKDGTVDLYMFLPGCPKVRLEVYVDTPAGYRPTTEPRVPVRQEGEVARFGFAPVKDQNP